MKRGRAFGVWHVFFDESFNLVLNVINSSGTLSPSDGQTKLYTSCLS